MYLAHFGHVEFLTAKAMLRRRMDCRIKSGNDILSTMPMTLNPFPRPRDQRVMEPYPYVYRNADGAAPSIKDSYDERQRLGRDQRPSERASLPAGMPIAEAPAENPNKPMSQTELMAWLRSKGVRVTGNGG
jgi:hypothetical protein